MLVGVAAFLGRWSRCLRAASAEPTRAYAVEPRQIPRNHLSYSCKFICITSCTYSGNYIYMHKQASWQFTYSFTSWKCKWTSAYATCLRKKNLDCLRGCLRTPTRTVKYQVNSLRSCIRSSLEYMRLVIQKKTLLKSICVCLFLAVSLTPSTITEFHIEGIGHESFDAGSKIFIWFSSRHLSRHGSFQNPAGTSCFQKFRVLNHLLQLQRPLYLRVPNHGY